MKQIGEVGSRVSGSLESRRSPGDLTARRVDEDNLPPAVDRVADIEIARAVWSSWIPSAGRRAIVRPLSRDERGRLEKRAAELEPALAPYRPDERDDVMIEIAEMFGAFPSMRVKDEEAMGKIKSAAQSLSEFPAWAIQRACRTIRTEGYVVYDGNGERRERHWPPSDPDIVDQVKREMRTRKEALDAARDLLSAPVEEGRS
jgi:hypothetical protein